MWYNFPKIKDNPVSHIRPHGTDGKDVDELPFVDELTKRKKIVKMCFWLNASYIKKVLDNNLKD